ncbi:MAG: tetratricopeptide repeat protein [Telmatospirillum sp.]|nr:tetratricopeptide repeat protein [Telmatospirillum sp.]
MNRKDRRAARATPAAGGRSPARLFQQALHQHEAGRYADAAALYRTLLTAAPHEPELHYNLGLALAQAGQTRDAVTAWRTALALRPLYPKASNNLGMTLAELGETVEAEQCLSFALAQTPDSPEILSNLAGVLRQQGRLPDAEALFHRAIRLHPAFADAYNSLGVLNMDRRRLPQAIQCFKRAIELQPDHAKAHFNLSLGLLTQGRFKDGWAEHEWRWRGGGRHLSPRPFRRPLWSEDDPAGRRILLHSEQGFGDTVQFIRLAKALADAGATVIAEVPQALVRLVATVPGVSEVVERDAPLPPFDAHLPLLSLPHRLGLALDDIPADIPYLSAPSDAAARWRTRLRDVPGLHVGLVWAGDPRPDDPFANAIDRRRSVSLSLLAPVLTVPGITIVSLQKGSPAAQLSSGHPGPAILDWTEDLLDFADTAALTQALDLVITVDTAMAHVAGALGRPVWILSRFDGCWRWLENRDDTPWYPTARLFRQTGPGDWAPVIDAVARSLAAMSS